MSILSLSHTDLDGVGCQIALRHSFGEITRMNLSYPKINEYLDILESHCAASRPAKVFITDLSFSYEQFIKLSEITLNYKEINFYFIDHHPFEGDYKSHQSDNFHIVISSKASATKLTYLYLKSNFGMNKDKDLARLIDYINAYDIWLEGTPDFQVGLVYNDIFWEYKMSHFWSKFKDNFKLRNNDKEKYRELIHKKGKLFSKLENSGRMLRLEEQGIFMVFLDDYKNHITLDYKGYKVYAILSSYGGFSLRVRGGISPDGAFKKGVVSKLLEMDNMDSAGGHNAAFGGMLKDSSAHAQVTLAKELLNIIDEELDNLVK